MTKVTVRSTAGTMLLIALLVRIIFTMLAGWYVMIAIGVIHAEVLPAVKPCSYWTSTLITLLFAFAARLLESDSDE